MKNKWMRWLLLATFTLFLSMPAMASEMGTVYFNGHTSGVTAPGTPYLLPPYGGTLTVGTQVTDYGFYCIDAADDINGGQSWTADISPVSNPDSYALLWQSKTTILELTYLESQFALPGPNQGNPAYQEAVWHYTLSTIPNNLNVSQMNDSGFTGAGWTVLVPYPIHTPPGGQVFLVHTPVPTPEPVSMLLFGTFLSLTGGLLGRKKRTA